MPYIKDAVNEQVTLLEAKVPSALSLAMSVRTAIGTSHPAYDSANNLVEKLSDIQEITDSLRGVTDDIPPEPTKSGRSWDGQA